MVCRELAVRAGAIQAARALCSSSDSRRHLATAYLGLGSNVGDRAANILKACKGLSELGVVDRTSFLYETTPMYIRDQPPFLNAACRLSTELEPMALLDRIKRLEARIGRANSTRWGPRAVDVDILTYDGVVIDDAGGDSELQRGTGTIGAGTKREISRDERWLQIPHPRMHERPFVLMPLADIEADLVHPTLGCTIREMLRKVSMTGNQAVGGVGRRVMPMGLADGHTRLWPLEARGSKAYVMGILNATPDSFSDGGQYSAVEAAVRHAMDMVRSGADIVDIGGESTRPGAADVSVDEELDRVVPVVERLATASANGTGGLDRAVISVDTRRAEVAKAAAAAGAHLINDVSGGRFDPQMLSTVAEAGVPVVMMHMRGTPRTMMSLTDYGDDVVGEVCESLVEITKAAESAGIPRWMQLLDPGIGFAKTPSQSLELLGRLETVAARVRSPLLVGPSRKRFIAELTREEDASRRDWGTVGACCSAVERGASFVRVHNVQGVVQALAVSTAIMDASRPKQSKADCGS